MPAATQKKSSVSLPVHSKTSVRSRMRAIGNSKGVILNNRILDAAGLKPEADIIIHAGDGVITIIQPQTAAVNTDLSTWNAHFKKAIKKGAAPEGDMFGGMLNEFDKNEW